MGGGITEIVIHPALNTYEMRAITPHWKKREIEYLLFMDEDIHRLLQTERFSLLPGRTYAIDNVCLWHSIEKKPCKAIYAMYMKINGAAIGDQSVEQRSSNIMGEALLY